MFILNSYIMILLICISRCYNIKDEEICDLMEKIWIKKELYFLSYEFLNFLYFSGFFQNLFWFLIDF